MKYEEMSLEQAMEELNKTVEKIDNSETSLEESIAVFENGVKLIARCRELLDGFDKRITVLKKTAEGIKEIDE